MHKINSICIIGISLVGGAMLALPARAIPTNQSDTTGTNIWNNTVPVFGGDSTINPEISNTAIQISKDLETSYAACLDSKKVAAAAPRRFAIGPNNSQEPCITQECEQLTSLVVKARAFLSGQGSTQVEQLRASRTLRVW